MARRLELGDMARFMMASNPQLSPDASRLAYVVTRIEGDGYDTTIMIVDASDSSLLKFLSGKKDRSPRWSPDGKRLLFLSDRGMEEGEKGTGVWLLPIVGGEPRKVAHMEGGVEQPRWGADGGRVYFISNVGEEDPDVKVVDSVPIWFNGAGFVHHRRKHLHVLEIESGEVEPLTEGDRSVACIAPSRYGGKVAYAMEARGLSPWEHVLKVYDIHSGRHDEVVYNVSVNAICWAPNEDEVLFLGHDRRNGYPTHVGLWVVNDEGVPRNLTESLDRGCSRHHYYDLRSPYAGMPEPVWEGNSIYFPVSDGPHFHLYAYRYAQDQIDEVIAGDFSIEEFSVRKGRIAYSRVATTRPAEIWVHNPELCVTKFNDFILKDLSLREAEHFEFTQRDETRVEGWILKPHGFRKRKKYPAVLDIHGGPRSKFGDSMMFEHQLYAAEGYGVIYLNIRGSDGYDQEFADIRGAYGVWDYEDLMKGLDYALEEFKWIDGERLGVTGLSYGGFMTNWVVTHNDRFKAAVSQNSISSWPAFFGTTDIGFHFAPDQIGGSPWSNLEGYIEKSPITYASDVSTPILFVHSLHDYRCWIDQSIQFYTALKYLEKPTRLVLFMEGHHTFRSVGRPSIREKRLEVMLDWFNQYLKP